MIRSDILTIKKIDNWLVNNSKSFIRVGDILGSRERTQWKCLIHTCLHEWIASPGNIKNHNSGCPKCAKNAKLTDEDLDQFIINNKCLIKRIGKIKNNHTKIQFLCLKKDCNHDWAARPGDIKNGTGCPMCAGNLPISNESFDEYIKRNNLPIKRIGNINTAKMPIMFECLNCSKCWNIRPNDIKSGSGCPVCNISHHNEKLVRDFFIDNNINFKVQQKIPNNYSKNKYFVLDFYLPILDMYVEYNGAQHYEPTRFHNMTQEQADMKFVQQQKRDSYVRQYCKNNGKNLLEIDGRIYKSSNLIKFLTKTFKKNGQYVVA